MGPGGPNTYIRKLTLFTTLGLLFSIRNSRIGGFGPFETLGDHFPRGTPRPAPPPPRPLESFLQPWRRLKGLTETSKSHLKLFLQDYESHQRQVKCQNAVFPRVGTWRRRIPLTIVQTRPKHSQRYCEDTAWVMVYGSE